MIKGLWLCFVLFLGLNAHAAVQEQEFLLKTEAVLANGATRLNLRFDLQHAKVIFRLSEDTEFIVKAIVKYDRGMMAPVLSERLVDSTFSVALSSGAVNEQDSLSPVHDWEIQIGRYDLPTEVTLNFMGVQTVMDFGGMPLTRLVMNLKGSQVELDFSEPTLLTVATPEVVCEGSFIRAFNIGNTGFETFQLKASGSRLELDFEGTYAPGDYDGEFSLKGSSARISLPGAAGAALVHRPANRLVELAGGGWSREVSGSFQSYRTGDYENAESRLNLQIESIAASVRVTREGTNLEYQLSY